MPGVPSATQGCFVLDLCRVPTLGCFDVNKVLDIWKWNFTEKVRGTSSIQNFQADLIWLVSLCLFHGINSNQGTLELCPCTRALLWMLKVGAHPSRSAKASNRCCFLKSEIEISATSISLKGLRNIIFDFHHNIHHRLSLNLPQLTFPFYVIEVSSLHFTCFTSQCNQPRVAPSFPWRVTWWLDGDGWLKRPSRQLTQLWVHGGSNTLHAMRKISRHLRYIRWRGWRCLQHWSNVMCWVTWCNTTGLRNSSSW